VISFAAVLLTFAVTTADGIRDAVAFQIGPRRRDAPAVWGTALGVMALAGPLGFAVLFGCWLLVPARPSYLFAACAFPFALFLQTAGIIYLLRDHIERINRKNALTIGGGSSLLILALVLVFHATLWTVMWVWAGVYALAALWSMEGLRAMLGGRALFGAGLLREQLGFAGKAALSSNVTFLALRVDVFIVSALLAPASLGIYTLALGTGEVLWSVSRALNWSTAGRVAMLDFPAAAALTARAVRSIVAVQFVAGAVLFAVGPWLIDVVYGPRFAAAGPLLRLLLPGMIVYSADGLLSFFISVRAARPGLLLGLETVTLVVCGGITLIAIHTLGIFAGALADTAAYLLSYFVKIGVFIKLSGLPPADVVVPRRSDIPAFLGGRAEPASS
jgi:O-antigen/teichoic acid export membrane protein